MASSDSEDSKGGVVKPAGAANGVISGAVSESSGRLDEKEQAAFQLQLSLLASQLMVIAQEPDGEYPDSLPATVQHTQQVKVEEGNGSDHDMEIVDA
jgi:hypothetical protein